ncbi:MAG: hypothetical protein MUC69_03010, partial [Gemmatimonadales bacterium]|nr:hypothetical protein [Gemmatimonadales bacterium]
MIVVGADAGGTRTSAAVWREGELLGRGQGTAGAVRPGRALAAAAAIADACRTAMSAARVQRGDVLVVGAAGTGRPAEREELAQALRAEGLATRVRVVTDIELVLAAAFGDGPGIALAAGTGSIAVRRDADGTLHRCGGHGWQMGDEGSGYALGRAALGAVSRARDGRDADSVLRTRLPDAARVAGFDALVAWAATATPSQVASLAPTVLRAAVDDAVARRLAEEGARDLAGLATRLVATAPAGAASVIALAGGLLRDPSYASLVRAS